MLGGTFFFFFFSYSSCLWWISPHSLLVYVVQIVWTPSCFNSSPSARGLVIRPRGLTRCLHWDRLRTSMWPKPSPSGAFLRPRRSSWKRDILFSGMESIGVHGSLLRHHVGNNGLQNQTQSHSEEEEKERERENGMTEFYNSAVHKLAVSMDLRVLFPGNMVMVNMPACWL